MIAAQVARDVLNARITQLGVGLFGGGGEDSLTGALRQDILIAFEGDDTLTGGAGADQFRIGAQPGGSDDTIADFSGLGTTEAGDRIRIADGATQAACIGAEVFTASGLTEVRYAHDMLKIDFDGDGRAESSFFLTGMTLATQLTQDDFK